MPTAISLVSEKGCLMGACGGGVVDRWRDKALLCLTFDWRCLVAEVMRRSMVC